MKVLASLLAALLCAATASAQQRPPRAPHPVQRARLAPQFAPGSLLRYQMEFRTTTETHRTGLIEDPQAPSKLELTWGAVVRVEVLGPAAGAGKSSGSDARAGTRLRATYERSVAAARTDSYDLEGAALEEQYRKLQGRSVEFTLDADGNLTEVQGLKEIFADERAASAARESFGRLTMGASLPKEGIAPGQKWSSEQPAGSAPIAGLVWRTESTYLRDERCRPASLTGVPSGDPLAQQTCAVILTRFEIAQPRALRDPTPDEYRRRGLRTAGKWSGSGESLIYISLRTGWAVSVTQSGTEDMDVTVSTADGESGVRYSGRVGSKSQITLLPESAPH